MSGYIDGSAWAFLFDSLQGVCYGLGCGDGNGDGFNLCGGDGFGKGSGDGDGVLK